MTRVGGLECAIRSENRPLDRGIADVADRQHGVVARRQLDRLGLSPSAIQRRLAAGRLHNIHRGVYSVGHRRVSARGRWMAAVLAGGSGALLSHRSAAALWGILPSASARIHITTDRSTVRRRGIILHRSRHVPEEDRAAADSIPVTSVARTLVDLAGGKSARDLARAVDGAERLGVFDLTAVERVMSRRLGAGGIRRLAALLDDYQAPPLTRSELEHLFLELCRNAGLPQPQTNVRIGDMEVDAIWADRRLVVELDGYASHRTRADFERDRERDSVLLLGGYRVLRITRQRLERDASSVTRMVKELLLSRSPERPRGAPGEGARALRGGPAG
jgi:very-short-patch-repair endonuclease